MRGVRTDLIVREAEGVSVIKRVHSGGLRLVQERGKSR